jgi:hypothetical protein
MMELSVLKGNRPCQSDLSLEVDSNDTCSWTNIVKTKILFLYFNIFFPSFGKH